MDKIIKTISESGTFRAYVLDSTETVRTAQENIIHKLAPRSHLAVPSLPVKSWRQTRKEILKLRSKSLGLAPPGAIITVADTKGNVKGYVQNPGVDIKRRQLVKSWWDHLSETENSWLSQIMVRKSL